MTFMVTATATATDFEDGYTCTRQVPAFRIEAYDEDDALMVAERILLAFPERTSGVRFSVCAQAV